MAALMNNNSIRIPTRKEWYSDTECSRHLTYVQKPSIKPHSTGNVTCADESKDEVKGVGKLKCTGQPNLEEELVVNGLVANLISFIQLCDQELNVNFAKHEFLVTNEEIKARDENIVSQISCSEVYQMKWMLTRNDVPPNAVTSCDDKWSTTFRNSTNQGRTKHRKATRDSTEEKIKVLGYVRTHFIKDSDVIQLEKRRGKRDTYVYVEFQQLMLFQWVTQNIKLNLVGPSPIREIHWINLVSISKRTRLLIIC